MNILESQRSAQTIKEIILREQLKNMLPRETELIDIVFCASDLLKMYNSYRFDIKFKPN